MKILIAGDVHGKFLYLQDIIKNAIKQFDIDCVIQVGDFGFYQHCCNELKHMHKFKVPIYAIDGNHENHVWMKENKNIFGILKKNNNVHFMPRGSVMNMDGRTIGFVGGAMNVDRPQYGDADNRTTNFLLDIELDEVLETFNNTEIDLMVTHGCPCDIGVGMQGLECFIPTVEKFITEPLGVTTGDLSDCGEDILRELYEALDTKPANWVFGHFHSHKQSVVDDTKFWCVGSTDETDSEQFCIPYIYDTENNSIEMFGDERI